MALRYKLLVVDLDGTLLGRAGTVSAANCIALEQARQAGLEVVIATGRALVESRRILEIIGHRGLVVAAGGSMLCHAATGQTLDRRVMPPDVVAEVTAWLVEHGHKVLILKDACATGYDYLAVGGGQLDPASQWWFDRLDVSVRFIQTLNEDLHPQDTVRAGAVACESKLGPLAGQLRQSMGQRCFLQHWSAVTELNATGSSTHLLEIFTANVSKWTMIHGYCQRMGIDAARVAAIGDGLNDVDLIGSAGLGIAMANAGQDVRSVADRITADHDADGVALAIDQILSAAW
jgi:hypothetical protein